MKLEVEHVEMVSTAQYIYENYICWLWLDEIPHNSRNSNDILAHGLCILLSSKKNFQMLTRRDLVRKKRKERHVQTRQSGYTAIKRFYFLAARTDRLFCFWNTAKRFALHNSAALYGKVLTNDVSATCLALTLTICLRLPSN